MITCLRGERVGGREKNGGRGGEREGEMEEGLKHMHYNYMKGEGGYLSSEVLGTLGWVILGVSCNIATANVLDRHILDVEPNIVSRKGLWQRLVMHLHRLHLSCNLIGGKGHHHPRFQDTGLHTTHRNSSNTCNTRCTAEVANTQV